MFEGVALIRIAAADAVSNSAQVSLVLKWAAVVAEREFVKSLARAFARSLSTSLVLQPD